MNTKNRFFLPMLTVLFILFLCYGLQLAGEEIADKGKLAYNKLRSADKLKSSGAVDEAVKIYMEAAVLYEEALKEHPEKSAYKNNYKYCLGKRGYIQLTKAKKLAEEKKYGESSLLYEAAIKAYEYALTKIPGNRGFENNMKYARINGAKAGFAHRLASKEKAPAFELESFSGSTLNSEILKGKVVLLKFWAGWCGSCKKAVPLIQELQKKYDSKGLEIVALSVDKVKGWSKGSWHKKAVEQSKESKFKFAWATEQTTLDFGSFPSIPTIILIDRNGKLARQISSKERTVETMSAMIEDLIK